MKLALPMKQTPNDLFRTSSLPSVMGGRRLGRGVVVEAPSVASDWCEEGAGGPLDGTTPRAPL